MQHPKVNQITVQRLRAKKAHERPLKRPPTVTPRMVATESKREEVQLTMKEGAKSWGQQTEDSGGEKPSQIHVTEDYSSCYVENWL